MSPFPFPFPFPVAGRIVRVRGNRATGVGELQPVGVAVGVRRGNDVHIIQQRPAVS